MRLIDTHCHLDDSVLSVNHEQHVADAVKAGVRQIVIPAVAPSYFSRVQSLAERHDACYFALGIHPLYIESLTEDDLDTLYDRVSQVLDHPKFVGIGETGLDFFVPGFNDGALKEKQIHFYKSHLRLAAKYQLPLILHARKSHDILLKYLRLSSHVGGICHAFNASFQQAQSWMDQGFCLGFGGAMTYHRALQIRRLGTELPLSAIVLETDAPDIVPEWVDQSINTPKEVLGIAHVLAELRQIPTDEIASQTSANAQRVLPRLKRSFVDG